MLEFAENPDGSATVKFDFNDEEVQAFFRAGVIKAIKDGIVRADEYNPSASIKRKQSFEMTWDQVDSLMIEELKDIYYRNMNGDKIDCSDDVLPPDDKLLDACNTLLEYIMPPSDYEKWKEKLDENLS